MDTEAVEEAIDFTLQTADTSTQLEAKVEQAPTASEPIHAVVVTSSQDNFENSDKVFVADNGFLMLHKDHPEYLNLIRLQIENQELMNWKMQLQARINAERAECVKLKRLVGPSDEIQTSISTDEPEYERIVDHYMKENALLEQKRILLAKEILDENISLIQLQVDLAMKQFVH